MKHVTKNPDILAAIQALSNKQDDTFGKILTILVATATTSEQIEKLSYTIEQLVEAEQCCDTKNFWKTLNLKLRPKKKKNEPYGEKSQNPNVIAGDGVWSYTCKERRQMKM